MKLASPKARGYSKRRLNFWITVSVFILFCNFVCFFTVWLVGPIVANNHHGYALCYTNGIPHYNWQSDSSSILGQAGDPSMFLTITLGFGSLTFTQAKAIDIIWDMIVGRGIQIILIFASYPIVRKALLFCMESRPVSFRLYSTVAFDKISMRSFLALCTPARHRRHSGLEEGRKHRPRITWIYVALFLVFGYVLIYPTIISVMTGYQTQQAPWVTDPTDSSSRVNVMDLESADYIIMDGSRINLTNTYPVNVSDPDNKNLVLYSAAVGSIQNAIDNGTYADITANATYAPESDSSYYGRANCSFSIPPKATSLNQVSSNVTVSGHQWTLPGPPLSVSWNYNQTGGGQMYLFNGNITFNHTWLQEHTFCQPTNTYQWGFSFLMLFTFVCATWLFAIILVTLQWVIHDYSRVDQVKASLSDYRDVLDLAQELKERLGDDVQEMPGEKLDEKINATGLDLTLDMADFPITRKQEKKQRKHQAKAQSSGRNREGLGRLRGMRGMKGMKGFRDSKGLKGMTPYDPVETENTSYETYKSSTVEESIGMQEFDSDLNRLLHRDEV